MLASVKPSQDRITEIGILLRNARVARGLALEEAARSADVPPEHLKELEAGYPKPHGGRRLGPTLSKLERVANVYGLSVDLVEK
jgi:transcriptional regulator with XRE-family HTH domain